LRAGAQTASGGIESGLLSIALLSTFISGHTLVICEPRQILVSSSNKAARRFRAKTDQLERARMQKKDPASEAVLLVLQTAKNRLEYVTQNDWMLIVDRAKKAVFKKDDLLIHQNRSAKMVYLICSGKVQILTAPKSVIATLGAGEICGEMAFLEGGVASASVVAVGDVEAYAIEWTALKDLFELFPHLGSRFYRSLAVGLSRRLRDQLLARQTSSS
jgi:cyclic nucleotide-binding protein